MLNRYAKTVIAVIAGNLLYFVVLYRHLPPAARHRIDRVDWGLAVDFWLCLACYGLLSFKFGSRPK